MLSSELNAEECPSLAQDKLQPKLIVAIQLAKKFF